MCRRHRATPSRRLLEIARSQDASIAELEEIVSELHERNNPVAFRALVEVGVLLQVARNLERVRQQRERRRREQEGYFEWPSTDAPATLHGYLGDVFFYKDGLLSYVGYRVGHEGECLVTRQRTLDCVFHNRLPRVDSPEYMEEWAAPETPERLHKLAETIAALTRNAKRRRDVSLDVAIADWEADLKYLYEAYYIGRFGFDWPGT